MPYAFLAHHEEAVIDALSEAEDAALMTGLHRVHDRLNEQGRLGPAARLGATGDAFTLRGPGAARDLRRANPSAVYEIRPIRLYLPGVPPPETEG